MKVSGWLLAMAGLVWAQPHGSPPAFPRGTAEFAALYADFTAELRRYEPRLAAGEREWVEGLIQSSGQRFHNWPSDPAMRSYLDRLDKIAGETREGPVLRTIGQAYLQVCLDLPGGIADSLERYPIAPSRAAELFRLPDLEVQRSFAGATDTAYGGLSMRIYRIFHSRNRTDSLLWLLSDRLMVWRSSAWINGRALAEQARRQARQDTLRRSFYAIAEPVMRSSRDPVEWMARLASPVTTVEPLGERPDGPMTGPGQRTVEDSLAAPGASANTARFRALYVPVTAMLHNHAARLNPAEREWLEFLIQGFEWRFEKWDTDPSLRGYLDRLDRIAAERKQGPLLRLIGQVYLHICLDLPRGIADSLERYPIPESRAADIFRLPNADFQSLFAGTLAAQHAGLGTRIYRMLHSRGRTDSLAQLLSDRLIVWRMTAWINGQALADAAGRQAREDRLRRSFDAIVEPVMRSSRDPAEWMARLAPPSTAEYPTGK
jgi:hypothetical protein